MTTARSGLRFADRFYIGGTWVAPSSRTVLPIVDSNDEQVFLEIPLADATDIDRAVSAARTAFDDGPWPRLSHHERGEYLRALGAALRERVDVFGDVMPRESGILVAAARAGVAQAGRTLDYYAGLAEEFPWEEPATPADPSRFALLVREPVGVVGAIVPWNGPLGLALYKIAPALLAGCTVVLKAAPEAPGAPQLIAEAADAAGIPPGVLNVLTADRAESELLVRDPRVDKIAFTGSTAAGRQIATVLAARIARYSLELGGKSAALVLDDADLESAAAALAAAERHLAGQVCASLTRIVVPRSRHDEFVELLAGRFAATVVGSAFDPGTQMGPLVSERQRERVESYIARGVADGATLAAGGGRPAHLARGYFVEPTVFANVDNSATIAQEEIFGPVLSVIPADDEEHAIRIANDSIYGLNAAVFTADVDRARRVASRLRVGTVGHNGFHIDFSIAFGGFKQSGVGREGGVDGLRAYLETQTLLLDGPPERYRRADDN